MEHIRQTGKPYVCVDLAKNQRFAEEPRLPTYGIRSYILCPLIVRASPFRNATMRRCPGVCKCSLINGVGFGGNRRLAKIRDPDLNGRDCSVMLALAGQPNHWGFW
jgi:GAF domain-containing protein